MTHAAGKNWEMHLGDCRDVLPSLGPVDAVVTDPPYGIDFAGRPTKWQRRAGQVAEAWDEATVADLAALLDVAPVRCVWGGNYYPLPPSRGWLVWVKPDAPPSMATLEMAWTNIDRNAQHLIHSISATNAERLGHPTQKPLRVMLWTLEIVPGETVLDPFAGSGTTGVACIRVGRKFVGIERDPKHFALAVERLRAEENQTTPKAERVGQTSLFGVERP